MRRPPDPVMTRAEIVGRILFAMVDMVLDAFRRLHWRLRTWPHHRELWALRRWQLGWWRSTW